MSKVKMDERQIEIVAERRMDVLDRAFMRGDLTEKEYIELVAELEAWADDEYRKLPSRELK
jgi:hypothetical protein